MAKKIKVKSMTGVYYTESTAHRWKGRPDRIYWICFKDQAGKLHWERCGRASEGWDAEKAQARRREILETLRKAGEYKPLRPKPQERITFAELMEEHYLPWARKNKKSWKQDECRYNKWLKDTLGPKLLSDITPKDLEDFKDRLTDEGLTPASVAHVLKIVRQAINRAIKWDLYHGRNPVSVVSLPKPKDNVRVRYLKKEEAEALLAELKRRSFQLYAEAAVSLFAGLRAGEVFKLTWQDVSFTEERLTIKSTKSGRNRYVPMAPHLAEILKEWRRRWAKRFNRIPGPSDLVFPDTKGKPKVQVSKSFDKAVQAVGLNEGIIDPRDKVVFHTLRHTFASWLVKDGTPLAVVRELLGHQSITTTMRYAHLAPDLKVKAVAQLPKINTGREHL